MLKKYNKAGLTVEKHMEDNLLAGRIDSLTGARFPAIICIVFSHFEFLEQYGVFGYIYSRYFHNATMGVDFFFMLSGFGMMLSSIKSNPSGDESIGGLNGSIRFAKRHVKKIYTPYLFFLIIGIPYVFLVNHFEQGRPLATVVSKSVMYFLCDLTLLQSATGKWNFSHSFNGVCWFLSCLFCIYLISPLIMKCLKRYIRTVRRAVAGIMISVMLSVTLSFVFSCIEAHTVFDDLSQSSPYRRVFYVIPGMILAQLFSVMKQSRRIRIRIIEKGLFEYLSAGVSIVWFFLRGTAEPALGSFVYVVDMILACCVLFALAFGKGKISGFFSRKTMVFLGDISMYIFISHYVIRNYTDLFVRLYRLNSIGIGILETVIILILSFACSIVLHKVSG